MASSTLPQVFADANESAVGDTNAPSQSSITVGANHTCALLTTGAVKCWGKNADGQLGDGTTTDSNTPIAVSGLSSGATAISAGTFSTCALLTTGAVKCWGNNAVGQIGDGTIITRTTPTAVSGLSSGVTAISVGSYHTCALLTTGAVKCWGNNSDGQLGNGTTTNSKTPIAVSGLSSGVAAITATARHTCALLTTGAVQCWGYNDSGRLGDGTNITRTTPTAVSGLSSGATAITAGTFGTCALLTTGAVKCWGYNGNGQVGDGTNITRTTPTAVSGLSGGATAITAGASHTCALLSTGAVQCWADNRKGQVGDGTTTIRQSPTDVSGLSSGVTAITAGGDHTCALLTTSAFQCWGNNAAGQIGDGTTTNRNAPTYVSGLSSGVGVAPTTTTTTTIAPSTTTTTTVVATTTTTAVTTTTSSSTTVATTASTSSTSPPPSTSSSPPATTPEYQATENNITQMPLSTQSTSPSPQSTFATLESSTTSIMPTTTTNVATDSAGTIEDFIDIAADNISTIINEAALNGGAALIINGRNTSVTMTTTTTSATMSYEDASLEVTCFDSDRNPIALSTQGRFTLHRGDSVSMTATGFAPGSTINVLLFSTPTALGSATTDASGRASQQWEIPETMTAGDHTLVFSGDLANVTNTIFGLRIVVNQESFVTRIASSTWTRIIVALGIASGLLIPATRRRRR